MLPRIKTKFSFFVLAARGMSDHGPKTMAMIPTRFQWHKFKDLFHFYVLAGLIPLGALSFYTNVFIGPAELTEIPEDYVPKHWEYYRVRLSHIIDLSLFNFLVNF